MTQFITYLNDHLAGSVGALSLLDHQIAAETEPQTRQFLSSLRSEIATDQDTLKEILREAGGAESTMRKAGAWVAEKLGRAKLGGDKLGVFQMLEALLIGIFGKRSLWQTLEVMAANGAPLPARDYARLRQRAESQLAQVEGKMREIAGAALLAE